MSSFSVLTHLSGPPTTPVASALPPFSLNLVADAQAMLSHDFMRNAFLAGTITAIVAGLIGYFVVLRHLAFAGDALSHVAFSGSLGAIILGVNPLVGLFGTTTLIAVGMGFLGERARGRDVAIGTVFAWVLGVGALFVSLYALQPSGANGALGVNILFGSIFGISSQQAVVAALIGLGTIAILLVIARPLLFVSLDPDVARARGVPVRTVSMLFLVLLAITVGEAVQVVGALLIFALLVTPAAIAERLVLRPYVAFVCSAALALAFTWAGLTIGFYLPLPVSFVISALAFATYVGVILIQRMPRMRHTVRDAGAARVLRQPMGS